MNDRTYTHPDVFRIDAMPAEHEAARRPDQRAAALAQRMSRKRTS